MYGNLQTAVHTIQSTAVSTVRQYITIDVCDVTGSAWSFSVTMPVCDVDSRYYSSYTPWASKRSVMISTLKKVNKMASNEENLVMSAYCKLKEFAKLRYPIPALLRACSVVAVTTRNPAWFQVINTFKRYHK